MFKLQVEDLSYSYPNSKQLIFSNLNWQLEGKGFYSLFGLSGSGKTTFARIIEGGLEPSSGIIKRSSSKVLYTSNLERLPGWMSIYDHLSDITPPNKRELLNQLINEFGIKHVLMKKFYDLSLGQKNRVNFLRYLVQDFDLLIIDEALANVDEPTRIKILTLTRSLFKNVTILYISHNVLEVIRFSKRVFILAQRYPIKEIIEVNGLDGKEIDEHKQGQIVIEVLKKAT